MKIQWLVTGLVFCMSPLVWAQTPVRLTLDKAVETALQQNPAVREAEEELREAEARLKQSRADYFPRLPAVLPKSVFPGPSMTCTRLAWLTPLFTGILPKG